MKKVKTHKGYIIATDKYQTFYAFTKDEWTYGAGLRTPEWDAQSLVEVIEWIG